jgi:hypothetical protein
MVITIEPEIKKRVKAVGDSLFVNFLFPERSVIALEFR